MPQNKNYSWLLFALLGYLVVAPIAEDYEEFSGAVMRAITMSWLLAFGVWSFRGFGVYFKVGMGIAIAGIILSILAWNLNSSIYNYASFATTFCFLLLAIRCIATDVVHGNEISANRVTGAVSLYLLMGMLWAIAYALLEMSSTGSFTGFSEPRAQGWSNEWVYFSFVTMTTLGYGDLAPLSATARTFAYMQAVFGQFYIAILVAGLVSAYTSRRGDS
jgi:hypothetical protein